MSLAGTSSENIRTGKLLISVKVKGGEKLRAKDKPVLSLKFSPLLSTSYRPTGHLQSFSSTHASIS